ncbi:hypothetical protein INT45_000355 [Circinella minor]|uniref:Uncharacterized protein n=1 Tax=Circinella minor TaxID=1195481 RepID=A0A8H7RZJ3_9FUNG|nr:hypothetical protein INT45_000355 [Circinella minor]
MSIDDPTTTITNNNNNNINNNDSLQQEQQRPTLNRRFSSASVIAQITLLGYPPKIQPQSSATRDQGRGGTTSRRSLRPHSPITTTNNTTTTNDISFCPPSVRDYTELDAVDQEAGCILIALSNHDPNKTTAKATELLTKLQHDSSQGVVQSENSAINSANNNSNVTWQEEKSDPIMILAAAAAAVNEEDENNKVASLSSDHNDMRSYSYSHESEETKPPTKRKWHGYHYNTTNEQGQSMIEDPNELYSDKRHRYNHPHHHQAARASAAPENTWQQDLSSHEKQNPRIKRNAMHAYITYMIYTDMTHARSRSDSKPVSLKSNYPRDSAASSPVPASTTTRIARSSTTVSASNGPGSISSTPTATGQYSPSRGYRFQSNEDDRTSSIPPTTTTNNTAYYSNRKSADPPTSNRQPQPSSTNITESNNNPTSAYPTSGHTDMTIQYSSLESSTSNHPPLPPQSSSESPSWYRSSSSNTSTYMQPPPPLSSSSSSNNNDRMHSPAPPPPQPPNLSSTAIVDRPLTAFLWDDNSNNNHSNITSTKHHSRQDSSIALPPLPFAKSSPSPHI